MSTEIKGKIHSFQSLGTLDGPGIRFVAFLQGCNLRCKCCHNPDTWDISEGEEYSAEEVVAKAVRFKEYFGKEGGITLSGGEPILQADFSRKIFELCHQKGINTCLDTSGSILNDSVKNLLAETDRVLLDFKYTDDSLYKENVGCSIANVIKFLYYLEEKQIPLTIRQVIIPTINDTEQNILKLKNILSKYSCVDKTELLPFRKICQTKYDSLGVEFPFSNLPEATKEDTEKLKSLLLK